MTLHSMADTTNSSKHDSPEQMLERALARVGKQGPLENGKKALLLVLDDTDGCYDVAWMNAGMSYSQCVALMEYVKFTMLYEMSTGEMP